MKNPEGLADEDLLRGLVILAALTYSDLKSFRPDVFRAVALRAEIGSPAITTCRRAVSGPVEVA